MRYALRSSTRKRLNPVKKKGIAKRLSNIAMTVNVIDELTLAKLVGNSRPITIAITTADSDPSHMMNV